MPEEINYDSFHVTWKEAARKLADELESLTPGTVSTMGEVTVFVALEKGFPVEAALTRYDTLCAVGENIASDKAVRTAIENIGRLGCISALLTEDYDKLKVKISFTSG